MPARFPELVHEDRRAFRLPESGFEQARNWASRFLKGCGVVALNAELARQADDEVPEVISILWDGYDAFSRGGWGFAAIDLGQHILSTAYACGLTDRGGQHRRRHRETCATPGTRETRMPGLHCVCGANGTRRDVGL